MTCMNKKHIFFIKETVELIDTDSSDVQFRKTPSSIEVDNDLIVTCLREKHSSNKFLGIFLISPSNILVPNDFTDAGIDICLNDEQKPKALFPIDFIDSGIVICISDLQ